jgi:hypothetical protein
MAITCIAGATAIAQTAAPLRSDYVQASTAWVSKSCFHELPSNNSIIRPGIDITDANGNVTPITPCPNPPYPLSFTGWADAAPKADFVSAGPQTCPGDGCPFFGFVEDVKWVDNNVYNYPIDQVFAEITVPGVPTRPGHRLF